MIGIVWHGVKEEEQCFGVGSPPCVDFTFLFQKFRAQKVDPQVVWQRRIEVEVLLRFCVRSL